MDKWRVEKKKEKSKWIGKIMRNKWIYEEPYKLFNKEM